MAVIIEVMKAILFGIVEGVTEWLPVSSTGHIILLQGYLKMDVSEEFWNVFEVVIQLGAIMAVVLMFWNKLWIFKHEKGTGRRVVKYDTIILWVKIIVACFPAAVIGILYDDVLDELFYHPLPVAVFLMVVGILFIVAETYVTKKSEPEITSVNGIRLIDALIIGLFQVLAAVFPGTSRSGSTIVGGIILGFSRRAAAEFTFFLAVPVMFGASLLKTLKFIVKGVSITGFEVFLLFVGTGTAFIVSIFAIGFLMSFIKKHDFKIFGWYRIVLGTAIILSHIFGKAS